MKSIETQGKTTEQAIEIGLYKLGAKREDVKIEILEQAGLFNKARVRISIGQSSEEETKVKELVEKLIGLMDLSLEVFVEERETGFFVNITGEDTALFIGKRGESIEQFQTIVNAIYNKDKSREDYKLISIDSNRYVQKREETLTNLAKRTAGKVIREHRDFKFEAMNSYERRIIHSALSGHDKVITESYGKEPYRYVVVKLKNNIAKNKNYDENKDYFEDDTIKEIDESTFTKEHRVDDN